MVIISGTRLKRAVTRMNMNYKVPEGMKTYIPGRSEERRRDYVRRQKWKKQESKIPHRIWIEIIYASVLCLSGGVAVVYFCLSLTLLGWRQSIQSIAVNVTVPVKDSDGSPTGEQRVYTMLQQNGMNSHTFCLIYLFLSFFLFCISFLALWFAAFLGRRRWYYYTWFNHGVSLVVELAANAVAFKTYPRDGCDSGLFRKHLKEFFKWYGILGIHQHNFGHEAMDKISIMQGFMDCCGVDSWRDYKNLAKLDEGGRLDWWPREIRFMPNNPQHDLLHYLIEGREMSQVPHTCCSPAWMHNIYCSEDVFDMDAMYAPLTPIADSRFSKLGCVKATENVCEQLILTLTWGCLYILIFRIVSYISLFILTYFIFEGNRDLSQTLFLLTEGYQGRKFVGHVKNQDDLNLDLVRHHDDRFKDGQTDWVPPDQTSRGVPKREREILAAEDGDGGKVSDWMHSGGNLVGAGKEPGSESIAIVQQKLSKKALEENPNQMPLYFGQEYDPNLTEEETYKKIESSQDVKTRKQLAEELKQRRQHGKRRGKLRGRHKRRIEPERPKPPEPEPPPPPPPPAPHHADQSHSGSHSHSHSKHLLDPHIDKLASIDSLGIDLPPVERHLLEEQRRQVRERELKELMMNKAKKKQLEAAGHKVPHYLLDLPPTPPDGELLYGVEDEDDNLVIDILETKGKRVPGKRRVQKQANTDKEAARRAKLNLPRQIADQHIAQVNTISKTSKKSKK